MSTDFKINPKYTFKSDGMSESELLYFSKFENSFVKNTIEESELYGNGEIIRQYCFYPKSFPIAMRNFHGISQWDFVTDHILRSPEKYIGLYSKRLVNDYELRTGKKAYHLQAPFAVYVKKNKIRKLPQAKGTIFFHAHSTYWTDKSSDTETIIAYLKNLPSTMQPVSISMFFVDIQKGRHKPYIEAGFPIYTSGSWKSKAFVHNFFEIIRNFEYCLSNEIGSHVFYCTVIGLKTTILNIKPTILSNTDYNSIASGRTINDHKQVQRVKSVFGEIKDHVTPEQRKIVEEELGITEGISLFRQSLIMYKAWGDFFLTRSVQKLKSIIKRLIGKA